MQAKTEGRQLLPAPPALRRPPTRAASVFQQCAMPSRFNPLSALMLAALLLRGEATSDLLSTWKALAGIAKQHKKQFEDEFHKSVTILESYKTSSFPIKCPEFNFSREACYHRLAKGLQVYTVLLRHVEREYPQQPDPVRRQAEEQLLREFDTPDRYHRKMTAHSILHHLKVFLADGTRAIFKRERAWAGRKAVTFHAANS
ncbi:interleukin-6-like [Salarias fasciatus]|uniref:interleukin-6-like n=1 Tax=Salarias fasciatus TaxID=181472 RepID=UPI00117680CD|nr:interleukin-6-like [Salarias fasciatus]